MDEASTLVESLNGCFYSIHDPRFDHKNPTTWGYKCLLLRKVEPKDWEEISGEVSIPILAEFYGETKDKASQRWEKAIYDQELGIGPEVLLEGLLVAICVDSIKKYGPIVWKNFLYPKLQETLKDRNTDNKIVSKVLSILQRTQK